MHGLAQIAHLKGAGLESRPNLQRGQRGGGFDPEEFEVDGEFDRLPAAADSHLLGIDLPILIVRSVWERVARGGGRLSCREPRFVLDRSLLLPELRYPSPDSGRD